MKKIILATLICIIAATAPACQKNAPTNGDSIPPSSADTATADAESAESPTAEPDTKSAPAPETKAETEPEAASETEPEAASETEPEAASETEPESPPVPLLAQKPPYPDSPASDFKYKEKDSTITVTKYEGSDLTVVIPESIDGKPVTAVADGTFDGNNDLVEVFVPSTVTKITDLAFGKKWSSEANLRRVYFMGDIPESFPSTEYSHVRNMAIVYRPDAKGVKLDENGAYRVGDYYTYLYDENKFSLPFAPYCLEVPPSVPSNYAPDGIEAFLEKIPSDKYEEYPDAMGTPLSATLVKNGEETELDIYDPRLVRIINMYFNSRHYMQYTWLQGSYTLDEIDELADTSTKVIVEFSPENSRSTLMITDSEFVLIKDYGKRTPTEYTDKGIEGTTGLGYFPYHNVSGWMQKFGFAD